MEIIFYAVCIFIILKMLVFPWIDERVRPETEADKKHREEWNAQQREDAIWVFGLLAVAFWFLFG
jgi:flagellar biosynthesis/type III secretory pathway M-ring protein FliF/YscJ